MEPGGDKAEWRGRRRATHEDETRACVCGGGTSEQGKPEAFVRDAMLFERLLSEREPSTATALRSAGVVPEAYAQKYFCGLCVHVLPFWALSIFLERFLEEGWRYLLKFALALVSTLTPRIQAVAPGPSAPPCAPRRSHQPLSLCSPSKSPLHPGMRHLVPAHPRRVCACHHPNCSLELWTLTLHPKSETRNRLHGSRRLLGDAGPLALGCKHVLGQ